MPRGTPKDPPTLDELIARVVECDAAIGEADAALQHAVDAARLGGATWAAIAEALGMKGRSSAQARFSQDARDANKTRSAAYQERLRKAAGAQPNERAMHRPDSGEETAPKRRARRRKFG